MFLLVSGESKTDLTSYVVFINLVEVVKSQKKLTITVVLKYLHTSD